MIWTRSPAQVWREHRNTIRAKQSFLYQRSTDIFELIDSQGFFLQLMARKNGKWPIDFFLLTKCSISLEESCVKKSPNYVCQSVHNFKMTNGPKQSFCAACPQMHIATAGQLWPLFLLCQLSYYAYYANCVPKCTSQLQAASKNPKIKFSAAGSKAEPSSRWRECPIVHGSRRLKTII